MIHLAGIRIDRDDLGEQTGFPFDVPIVRSLESLDFPSEVTFLVGENGSGKSTLLEAIALATRLPAVGSERLEADATLEAVRPLANYMRLSWNRRTHRGFFMRTEDFFGFSKRLSATRAEYEEDLRRVERETEGRSILAQNLARLPYRKELHEMERRYGKDLSARSHGESYFTLFHSRFVPQGLYMLDEPEAPLSPVRQLAFISTMKEMVEEKGAQFIVATHSPILMAYPGATIYSFNDGEIRQVPYDELEHVTVTRDFLNNPEQFLRHL
jgi:predicted ATPase